MSVIVDSIITSFRSLFSIRLDHAGYERTVNGIVTSSIFNDLSLVPDEGTRALFGNYGLGFKSSNNTVICYVRSASGKSFQPFPDTTIIRLLVQVSSGFLKRTAIEPAGSTQVYQFTNIVRTGGGPDKYLTKNVGGVSADDLFGVSVVEPATASLAVIDIFTKDVGNDYRLFDASGNILGGNYHLGFTAT